MFDVKKARRDFPILSSRVNGVPLIYFDNAATTHKPRIVTDAIARFYRLHNSNVHRGAHTLSTLATQDFERARTTVADFIGSSTTENVIWTSGATASANLIAFSFAEQHLASGDVVLISTHEHHANIVPWQQVALRKNARIIPIPLAPDGTLDQSAYLVLLNAHQPKIICLTHVSNALGIINPIKEMISAAKKVDATVVIDGSQAIAHIPINVESLNCDFYFFSSHKCYGPTGVGVLWGKTSLLEAMPPWQSGGEMIKQVSFTQTTFAGLPYKFEAGTPPIAEAISLAEALNYLMSLDRQAITKHEQSLRTTALQQLKTLSGITLFAPDAENVGIISFKFDDLQNQDIAILLDQSGIAVRSGHHCAMPLMEALNCSGTLRVSFALYNTLEEVTFFCEALKSCVEMLRSESNINSGITDNNPALDFVASHKIESCEQQLAESPDWQSRFGLLMSLSEKLPTLPTPYRQAENQVTGCESNVWLVIESLPNEHWQFVIDSDSRLIKGIGYLLLGHIQGQSTQQINSLDINQILKECKLDRYLSPSRTNGVNAILVQIKKQISQK